jgi:hypothetical protein
MKRIGLTMFKPYNVIEFFNLKEDKALKIIKRVTGSISNWKVIAKDLAMSKTEIDTMEAAFLKKSPRPDLAKKDIICLAIKNKQRIRFYYNEKERVGEPQCCGISSGGKEAVRVYLLKGGSRPEQLFTVDLIKSLQLLDEYFTTPGPNYRRDDSAMKKIHCQL